MSTIDESDLPKLKLGPTAAGGPPGGWATIREAIKNSQLDFTQMSVGRAVILLAVPMVLEMSMKSLFAVVDIF